MFLFRAMFTCLDKMFSKMRVMRTELMFGRRVSLDKDCHIAAHTVLAAFHGAKLTVGVGCWFNKFCSVGAREMIEIGDNCIFGENVKIYDHNHKHEIGNIPFKDQGFTTRPIKIGNNCWVGSNVVIVPGGGYWVIM